MENIRDNGILIHGNNKQMKENHVKFWGFFFISKTNDLNSVL